MLSAGELEIDAKRGGTFQPISSVGKNALGGKTRKVAHSSSGKRVLSVRSEKKGRRCEARISVLIG